jgi:hypothetical protein
MEHCTGCLVGESEREKGGAHESKKRDWEKNIYIVRTGDGIRLFDVEPHFKPALAGGGVSTGHKQV